MVVRVSIGDSALHYGDDLTIKSQKKIGDNVDLTNDGVSRRAPTASVKNVFVSEQDLIHQPVIAFSFSGDDFR